MRDQQSSRPASQAQREFVHELEIQAPPAAVWAAISTAQELQRWFAPQCEVVPEAGGHVLWQWGDAYRWRQTIERWQPGRHLRTRYDGPATGADGKPVPLFIDFHLAGEGGSTTLRLVHSGFGPEADFDREYDGISRGWPVELGSLQLYLERHRGHDRQLVLRTATAPDLDKSWQRLIGDRGLRCADAVAGAAEGAPFRFTTAAGETFAGTVLACRAHEFNGIADSHGGAFLRLCVEDCGGTPTAWLQLGAYQRPAGEIARLAGQFEQLLLELFDGVDAGRWETASS